RGLEYYWIGLPRLDRLDTKGHTTDFEAINQGFVSITPVHLDMTSYADIEALESWL
ncbi:MAG TPA: 5'/3'-nucleotidase SurE, partial [Sulfurovum sp.]|nr:5'/3'-nucleotidase SurE [Sulfurovum sp.]